jgi:hypothetical protein
MLKRHFYAITQVEKMFLKFRNFFDSALTFNNEISQIS